MGVYLPNMDMPKGCAFCRIGKRNGKKMVCPLCDEEWDIHDSMSADHRLDNCHLVPVPPHGRLIDADELWVEINKICDRRDAGIITDLTCVQQILSALRHAPTSIPFEDEEECSNE